jgi:hypothetical protein
MANVTQAFLVVGLKSKRVTQGARGWEGSPGLTGNCRKTKGPSRSDGVVFRVCQGGTRGS